MNTATYFLVAFVTALYFALHEDVVEQGDWAKATGLIIICALWPVAIGLGCGLMLGDGYRAVRRFLAKARGEQ